jgi:hypothetical protein
MVYIGKNNDDDREKFDVDGHFDKKKIIQETLPGMVIINLKTEKGKLKINY